MKADKLHAAKCMGANFAAPPQSACYSDPVHCSWQTSYTTVFSLSRINESLAHSLPKKVIHSTHGLAIVISFKLC